MRLNLYKLEEVIDDINGDITYESFVNEVVNEERKYIKVQTIHSESLSYDFFLYSRNRSAIPWLDELKKVFNSLDSEIEYGAIYNGIIVVRRSRGKGPVYALSFGHSFHVVQEFCDYNFAMDFAEREIVKGKVNEKASDFIQSNKIRALINLKDDYMAEVEGGESYKFVSGKPEETKVYGENIDCGYSIRFYRDIELENVESFQKIENLIKHVEESLNKNNNDNFPRVQFLQKKDKRNEKLDAELLESMKDGKDVVEIYSSKFDVIGAKILQLDSHYTYTLYVKNNPRTAMEVILLSIENLTKFVQKNKDIIHDLDDIKITLRKSDDDRIIRSDIKSYLFSIIKLNGKEYMLTGGRWGLINKHSL
jgi:uncharacterized protein (TIGR04141 family)